MPDKNEPSYWFNVIKHIENGGKVVVRLSDQQTIEESISRGAGTEGIDHAIKSVRKFVDESDLSTYLLFELVDAGVDDPDDLYLCVKIVDNEIDMRVYFIDENFEPRLRSEIIDAEEDLWLYDEDDVDDYLNDVDPDINSVSYVEEIEQTLNKKKTITFEQKSQGELYGTSKLTPPESGVDEDEFTTIVEYSTEADIENPELMILEVGNDEDTGGFVTVLPGSTINESEVDVLMS